MLPTVCWNHFIKVKLKLKRFCFEINIPNLDTKYHTGEILRSNEGSPDKAWDTSKCITVQNASNIMQRGTSIAVMKLKKIRTKGSYLTKTGSSVNGNVI